jgi:hypothetical protein
MGPIVCLALTALLAGCGSAPPPPAPPPEPIAAEPEPPPPEPEPEPEPEAGRVELSTAFLVGGDMPSSTRDQVTEQVVQAIKNGAPLFRRCYAKAAAQGTPPRGEIDVELVIKAGGSIGVLRAGKATLTEEGLVACTVRAFEKLELPSPPADYSIVAPIQYYPE